MVKRNRMLKNYGNYTRKSEYVSHAHTDRHEHTQTHTHTHTHTHTRTHEHTHAHTHTHTHTYMPGSYFLLGHRVKLNLAPHLIFEFAPPPHTNEASH